MSDIIDEELSHLDEDSPSDIPDIVYSILISLIGGFGIIGNTLSFFILTRPQLKSPINICLQFLAVFDTLLLFCAALDAICSYSSAIYWAYFVQWISWTGSIWSTVGVSVERYIAVCYPLRAKYLCNRTRTVLFNLFITVCSVVYNLPRVCLAPEISWKGESVEYALYLYKRYGKRSLPHIPSWFFKHKLFIEIYYIWLDIVVLYSVPLLTLVVLNMSIYFAVRRAETCRQQMSQHRQAEIKLSNMIFCVILVFLICYTPMLLYKIVNSNGIIPLGLYLPLSYTCSILTTANSALNFIIYTALRKDFRDAFIDIFCCFRV